MINICYHFSRITMSEFVFASVISNTISRPNISTGHQTIPCKKSSLSDESRFTTDTVVRRAFTHFL